MTTALAQLADRIRRESGIVVDETMHRSLEAAVSRAAPEMDASALLGVLDDSPQGPELLRRLIDEVTVNETTFFRHATNLLRIDWAELLNRARSLGAEAVRVWVAGCATGEEAYTLAMLACEAFAPPTRPVSIVATDISAAALAAARRGVYGPRSIRGIEPELRTRYLAPHDKELAVAAQLRRMVTYTRHNLVRDPPPLPGSFDLITCRNVLIYFDPATAERVVASLQRTLSPGGTLILGAADRISLQSLGRTSAPQLARGGLSAAAIGRRGQRATSRIHEPWSSPTKITPARRSTTNPGVAGVSRGLPEPAGVGTSGIRAALAAANVGRLALAIELIVGVLASDPLNAEAHFVRGLAELGAGDWQAAKVSLRRALFVCPDFWLAAFKLGRALEVGGEQLAAAQAYRQTLRTLDRQVAQPATDLDPIDTADVAAACRLRLRALGQVSGAARLTTEGQVP